MNSCQTLVRHLYHLHFAYHFPTLILFKIDVVFSKALIFFCKSKVATSVEKYQASTKKVADILDFAIQFDQLKMSNPNIQNDFSYYRRTISRMKMTNAGVVNVVSDDVANKMSLFFAHSNPAVKALIDATKNTTQKCELSYLTDFFSILAAVSYSAVKEKRTTDALSNIYFLRVMTVSIVIFDHVDEQGAFVKNSKIRVRNSIKMIQSSGGTGKESMLNSLRFSTVHVNHEATPKSIKALLAAKSS